MSGPRLNMIALVGSIVCFAGSIVVDGFVEERAREVGVGYWHFAYLVAPSIQIVLACISVYAVIAVARRRRHVAETVLGTLLVVALTAPIILMGVSAYRRYSWVVW